MAKKVTRPKIKVQPVYSGGADMREVFISLLVDAVRRGKCPVRTFLVWIKKMQGQKCRHVSTFGLFFATYLNYVQSLECYRPILSTVRIVVVFVDIAELENNHSIF